MLLVLSLCNKVDIFILHDGNQGTNYSRNNWHRTHPMVPTNIFSIASQMWGLGTYKLHMNEKICMQKQCCITV